MARKPAAAQKAPARKTAAAPKKAAAAAQVTLKTVFEQLADTDSGTAY
jgi:hypothetical protein